MKGRAYLAIVFFALLILVLRFISFTSSSKTVADGKIHTLETLLLEEPKLYTSFQQFTLYSGVERIQVRTSLDQSLHYGQKVRVTGPIRILPRARPAQREAREGQSYGASTQESHLLNQPTLIMYFPKISLEKNNPSPLLAFALALRQNTDNLFRKTLPGNQAALLLGIVYGGSEGFSRESKINYRNAGVLHVVAASGMNVTLLSAFILPFFLLFLRRQYATVLTVCLLVFYALVTGFAPPILRAVIMSAFAYTAQMAGKQYLPILGLFLTAFFMLFLSPLLVYDIGFQLSFLATLGILYAQPLVSVLPQRFSRFLFNDIVTTVAAQLATLPILLFYFGSYGSTSTLVNALVLWTVPILMVLGLVASLLGFIIGPLGSVFLFLAYPYLFFFDSIVGLFAKFPILSVGSVPWQFIVSYYAFLVLVYRFLLTKLQLRRL